MEKLKKLVPNKLKREIAESSSGEVLSVSSSLIDFFLPLQEFDLIVGDLADPERGYSAKDEGSAKDLKHKGNQCYSNGNYSEALGYYSKALRVAPLGAQDNGKDLVSVLYVNRAAVLYKLGSFVECRRDCDRALRILLTYAKAWFWRGKVNAALGDYNASISDLRIANSTEESLAGKRQIENELKIALNQCKESSSCSSPPENDYSSRIPDVPCEVNLKCVFTPEKGRGMITTTDLPSSSLVHVEEPYAAVILKKSRETHCHCCFSELPVDVIPCTSCSIHLYCSEKCRSLAGGKILSTQTGVQYELPSDLITHMKDVTIGKDNLEELQHFPEHKHECSGANWPVVLPPEVVLAGRIIAKFLNQTTDDFDQVEGLDIYHNLGGLSQEIKLELHIYSMVLLFCLQRSSKYKIPVNAASLAKIVVLLCKIRLNSMAIVRMKSVDLNTYQLTSTVEQVRVGQAIYESGSLFNHSCLPNIHVYFLSSTLYIRTTENVAAGSPLEFSYGPQIGEWNCKDRINFLKEEYYFQCKCIGCSTLNLSDLALGAFHCFNSDCSGIVLEMSDVMSEKHKIEHVTNPSSLQPYLQVEKLKNIAPEKNLSSSYPGGYCLNCGSYGDLDSWRSAVDKSWSNIRQLQNTLLSGDEISGPLLSTASESVEVLRLKLHLLNRRIAEAEDVVAQALCSTGEVQAAMRHCIASIEILEKLYNPCHIVIAYELLKLVSIQMCLGDSSSAENVRRLRVIFKRYYGSHTNIVFPHLQSLKIHTFRVGGREGTSMRCTSADKVSGFEFHLF